MKRLILLVFILANLLGAADYYTNRILFCLNKSTAHLTIDRQNNRLSTNLATLNEFIQKYEAVDVRRWLKSADPRDVVGEVDLTRVYRIDFAADFTEGDLNAIKSELETIAEIHSADFESINRLDDQYTAYSLNDPMYADQWWLTKIQSDYAWGLWLPNTPGSASVIVGVVDSGVDYLHPDLETSLYINPTEDINHDGLHTSADHNGLDDDANGYVDDVRGWDFGGPNSGGADDNDIRPPDAGPYKELSHGTHVTGIIAAMCDNSIGVGSVSYRSKVVATKNAADDDLTEPGIVQGYDGILYCAKLGAKFINCSWGGTYLSSYERNILDDVSDNYGATVVGASGNENWDNDTRNHYPSDYSKCVSVAATNNTDGKSSYSNYGSVIDISAPGGEGAANNNAILSTIHANAGSYEAWQGTSMASPVVAGSFALLKVWFPSQTRQWYIDEILASADDIDAINPDYAGQLGSGRVNAYTAIASNIYPKLTISSSSYAIISDNGDGQLNPGEQARLTLNISNDANWSQAANVNVTLSSANADLTFPDATAAFGTINAGATVSNSSDELIFQVATDAPLEPLQINVSIVANQSGSYPYSTTGVVEVSPSMNQDGFPISQSACDLPILAEDILPGQPGLEFLTVGDNDNLYMYLSNGTIAPGFPVAVGGVTAMSPVVADVDADGALEIAIATKTSSIVKIYESNGAVLLNKTVGENIYGSITVANMDADAQLEIVFGTMTKKVHIYNVDGSEMSGFPYTATGNIDKGIAVADLTGDNIPEMVFGVQASPELYALTTSGTVLTNFPVDLTARVGATPLIVNLNRGYNIIVTTTDKKVLRVTLDGVKQFEKTLTGLIKSSAACSDFDYDGELEIAVTTDDAKLWVVNFAGDTIAPFPRTLDAAINTSPVFADFNNDNDLELIATTSGGRMYAYEPDGSLYANFPALFSSVLNGSPCIADLDADNDLEIIAGGGNGIYAVDVPGQKSAKTDIWMTYLANNARTGYYLYTPGGSDIQVTPELPRAFALQQNYPNPFNPETTIQYQLASNSFVQLNVYNLLGQKVKTLFNGDETAGMHSVKWNGRNSSGAAVVSGVYFYKLIARDKEGKEHQFTHKMALIR
jgi:hypothetical protein